MSNTLSPEFRLNPSIYRKLPCLKACDIPLISIFHLNVLMLTHEDGSGKRPMFLWPVGETDRIEGLFGDQGPNQINDDENRTEQVHDETINGSFGSRGGRRHGEQVYFLSS